MLSEREVNLSTPDGDYGCSADTFERWSVMCADMTHADLVEQCAGTFGCSDFGTWRRWQLIGRLASWADDSRKIADEKIDVQSDVLTVGALRDVLATIPAEHDGRPVVVGAPVGVPVDWLTVEAVFPPDQDDGGEMGFTCLTLLTGREFDPCGDL